MLLASFAHADDDTLRCGSKLVRPGLDTAAVLAQCGEPTARSQEEVPQMARRANGTTYVTGTIVVEHWTYDRGSSQFPAHLKFEAGKLVSIEFERR
ncbi:MAG: DUF2845 domain-containing protein [Gammaproteobacteria bacterium]|nr:DUF2845 domain-containing protein [Gammaproteobacteria bacterium]